MLRKRLIRSNNKLKKQYTNSPRTKADNLISDPNKKEEVKKALVFAEVMKNNLESNYEKLKTNEEQKVFKENIEPARKTLKNYKMLTKIIQPKLARKVNLSRKLNETKYKVQEDIKLFFESDDNTRMAAGKKECITRKKEKKQKRNTILDVAVWAERGTPPKSFCTYSDCLRHDALGVWGHLVPILKYIENTAPNTDTLHIITDSTCSQYRNKTINFMITKLHWYLKNLVSITWNYTEAGHGKGAPDGVGATLKRTADQIVRYGRDIPDVDTFATEMKKAIKNVVLEYVSEYNIYEKEYFLPSVLLRPFKGMMQVHQIVWNKDSENSIVLRRQSCISENCRNKAVSCFHGKHLGFYNLPMLDSSEKTKRSVIITSNVVIVPAYNTLPLNPDSTLNKDCSELFIEDIGISVPESLFDPPHMQPDSISEVCTESFLQDVVPNPPASWNEAGIDKIMAYEGENNVPKSLSVLATAACNISLKLDLKTTEICPKTFMQDVESKSSVAYNILQLTENQDCELLNEDSSGNIKSFGNQTLVDIYSIDDQVLVDIL
ncbi:hypothetical protein HF086_009105 [Spodoptera exigua]|uniref:Uncharacterized protein n=1 Tax=Spodoptera exigua TaxID=7107 RepID=A0A922MNZ8_SPOEX|nr:hypothetical protein HF086_009105 [Spodoptera exigua]